MPRMSIGQVGSSLIMPLHPEIGRVAELFFSGQEKEAMALVAKLWDLQVRTAKTPTEYLERMDRFEAPTSVAQSNRELTAQSRKTVRAMKIVSPDPLGHKTHRAILKALDIMADIRKTSIKHASKPKKTEAGWYIWWILPKYMTEVMSSELVSEPLKLKLEKLSEVVGENFMLVDDNILPGNNRSSALIGYKGLMITAEEKKVLYGKVRGSFKIFPRRGAMKLRMR